MPMAASSAAESSAGLGSRAGYSSRNPMATLRESERHRSHGNPLGVVVSWSGGWRLLDSCSVARLMT